MNYFFDCTNCKATISCDYSVIGDVVECPSCGFVQIVPESIMYNGEIFGHFKILSLNRQGMLWTEYLSEKIDDVNRKQKYLLKLPTLFFIKRVSDFPAFAGHVISAGTSKINGLEELTERSLKSGEEYFAYDYDPDYKYLSSIIKSGIKFRELDALMFLKRLTEILKDAFEKQGFLHGGLDLSTISMRIAKLEPLISNIGISRFLLREDRLLNSGFNIWDQRYTAPELFLEGRLNSPRQDLYSLGRIFYSLLTAKFAPQQFSDNGEPIDSNNQMISNLTSIEPAISINTIEIIQSLCDFNEKQRLDSYNILLNKIIDAIALQKNAHPVGYKQKNINLWAKYGGVDAFKQTQPSRSGIPAGLGQRKKLYLNSPHQPTVIIRNKAGDSILLKNVRPVNYRNLKNKSSISYGLIAAVFMIITAAVFLFNNRVPVDDSENKPDRSLQVPIKTESIAKLSTEVNKHNEDEKLQTGQKRIDIESTPPIGDKLNAELKKIQEFEQENPTKYDQIIARYEEIKRPYVMKAMQREIGIINEFIFNVEKKKQKRIDEVVQQLIAEANKYIEQGQREQAVLFLDSYQGEFVEETKRQRKEIARRILEGETILELKKGEAIKILDSLFEKEAENLLCGNISSLMTKLKSESVNPAISSITDLVEEYISDLEELNKIQDRIKDRKINAKIAGEELDKLDQNKRNLLKGLFFALHGDFDKAYEYFDRMHYGIGVHLKIALYEIDAEKTLQQILERYSIEFKPDVPEVLGASLYKKQLQSQVAKSLLEDIKNYESSYADSLFLERISSQLDTIKKYCFNRLDTDEKIKERELIIDAGADGVVSSGAQLLAVLEKADNWTTIRLKKGIYSFSSQEERQRSINAEGYNLEQRVLSGQSFSLSLTGLKLIGEEGVIFENDITITAQSVEISNIEIRRGSFLIVPHAHRVLPDSGNIIVRNCIFNDKETRIRNGINISFENCFMRGMIIEKSRNVTLTHCTIVSQERGLSRNAALWIDGDGVNIFNCLIYGNYLGVIFSDKGKNITKDVDITSDKGIQIVDSLLYGERGLCAFQFEHKPLEEKDFVVNSAKVSKYCKPKRNIYYPPQFIDPANGNWRLVKGTPGYKGGVPSYKGGPLTYRNKNAKDVGVLWDEINQVPQSKSASIKDKR